MSRWRLIVDGAASGPWNMGIDEALLESACEGGPPTLRLYRWQGPWLSLGYAQTLPSQRALACERAGIGVVRRVTGGRAVLHGGDLTYALAAPEALLPGGLSASYETVCRALVDALRRLGVDAEPTAAGLPAPARGEFDCFAVPAGREICVAGRKLAGSAQRRARGGVLQHGSIRVLRDSPEAIRVCGLSPNASTQLCDEGKPGVTADFERVSDACVEAFAAALDCRFDAAGLSEGERSRAARRDVHPDSAAGSSSAAIR